MYTHRSSGRLEQMHVDAASPLVAVAIDKDKGSQNALKWAAETLVTRGHTLTLIHVNVRSHSTSSQKNAGGCIEPMDHHTKELLLPFRCFCTRKNDVVLEGHDVAKAITKFVSHAAIEKLVVGAPSKGGLMRRFKHHDITANITKGAPDFCTVYVIAKGKVSAMKNATGLAPIVSPLRDQIQSQVSLKPNAMSHHFLLGSEGTSLNRIAKTLAATSDVASDTHSLHHEDSVKSSYAKVQRGSSTKSYADTSFTDTDISFVSSDTDISFVSSGRPSNERSLPLRLSSGSEGIDNSFEMVRTSHKSVDPYLTRNEGSTGTSWSSQTMEDVEEEMKRLRLELKHTMDMYNKACKEALTAKQKAMELQRWKIEEEKRLYEAHMAEEAAMALVERERAKCRAAIEAAQAEHRLAELEAQKRIDAEMKAIKEAEVMKKALDSLAHADVRYRKYAIEEIEAATEYFADHHKIGEGGYGPVYKCYLDHTAVAVKVLRPDAAQGRSQFHQEVEILSCIRHPNMVLLLGACPEYSCLVYEYMANGSLEDRLFRRGNTPVIPWQYRFQIAAEIATCLLFLHHKKPEPLVHRDLKPGNILLDKYYVSKISDVGLARLVPPSVANSVIQYHMTSTAGTFYYIDPEYQQTGMLGVKSDIYSLGILLLQIITAKPPAGLTHHVSHSIEKGTFDEMLDAEVTDWPVEEAQRLAEIALKCTELRRKDRPDLERVVLPELERLRSLAEDNMLYSTMPSSTRSHSPSIHSQVSPQDIVSDSLMTQSGYESSSESSATGR